MADKLGTLLTSIDGFPADAAEQLAGLWITTAEELIAAAEGDGVSGLAEYLNATPDETAALVAQAQAAVPDFAPVRDVLEGFLEADHEIEAVAGGAEALERAAKQRYDVALIDLGMPEMPGDQVARELRRLDPSLATVLITGWRLEPRHPSLKHFDFHLQKPFNEVEDVQSVIDRAIRLRDSRENDTP